MSNIIDEPDSIIEAKTSPSNKVYWLIVVQLLFHLSYTIFEVAPHYALIVFFVLLPFVVLYFLLPMFVLLLLQLFLYVVATHTTLKDNSPLGKLIDWGRHHCDYWMVLIVGQAVISLLFLMGMNPF